MLRRVASITGTPDLCVPGPTAWRSDKNALQLCLTDTSNIRSSAIARSIDPTVDPAFYSHLLSLTRHAVTLLRAGKQTSSCLASIEHANSWIAAASKLCATAQIPTIHRLEEGWLCPDVFRPIQEMFSFLHLLPLTAHGDVRWLPADVLCVDDNHGSPLYPVQSTHLIRIGQLDSDGPYSHPWYVYVNAHHQAITSIRAAPAGPLLSNHALCALVDIARRNEAELQAQSAYTSAEQAFENEEIQSRGEWPTFIFFLPLPSMPCCLHAVEHSLIFGYSTILFSRVDGLLAILLALGERMDAEGRGFCHGFSLLNPAAVDVALGNGAPLASSDAFGAGFDVPVGHYLGRISDSVTHWTISLRWSVIRVETEGESGGVTSDARANGQEYYGRNRNCPVFLVGGQQCQYCSHSGDNARKLRCTTSGIPSHISEEFVTTPLVTHKRSSRTDPAFESPSNSPPPTSCTDDSSSTYVGSPQHQRRGIPRNYHFRDAITDVEKLTTQLKYIRDMYDQADRDKEAAMISLKSQVLPPEIQSAVLTAFGYAKNDLVEQELGRSQLSPLLQSFVRACIRKEVNRRKLGKPQLSERYPVEVIMFAIDLYASHSKAYDKLRSHLPLPCADTLKRYLALPDDVGELSQHQLWQLVEALRRRNWTLKYVALLMDEIYLKLMQRVHGGAGFVGRIPEIHPGTTIPSDKKKRKTPTDVDSGLQAAVEKVTCDSQSESDSDNDEPTKKSQQVSAFSIVAIDLQSKATLPLLYLSQKSMQAVTVSVMVERACAICAQLSLVVALLISDGAGHFRLYRNVYIRDRNYNWLGPTINGFTVGICNPVAGFTAQPIIVLSDTPHTYKNVWNRMTKSRTDKKGGTQLLRRNSVCICNNHMGELLKLDAKRGAAAAAHSLVHAAYEPVGPQKMRTNLARRAFDAGAGHLLEALADEFSLKPLPERSSLVATAEFHAMCAKMLLALLSHGCVYGSPSRDESEAPSVYWPRQLTTEMGTKTASSGPTYAITQQNLAYMTDALLQQPKYAALQCQSLSALPATFSLTDSSGSVYPTAAQLAWRDLQRHPILRMWQYFKYFLEWHNNDIAEQKDLVKQRAAQLREERKRAKLAAMNPSAAPLAVVTAVSPRLASSDVAHLPPHPPSEVSAVIPHIAAACPPLQPDQRSKKRSRNTSDQRSKSAPPRHQHVRDSCITPQAIADMRTTIYGLVAYVWCFVDTPNRRTTLVRRFCHANALPVIQDEDGDYDDAAVCLALARESINWMALVVDDDGYVTPAKLSEGDRLCSEQVIRNAALATHSVVVVAPAPQKICRESYGMHMSDVANTPELRFVVLEYAVSDKIEQFFREMRANTTHAGSVGAIGSDQIARRWSVVSAMYYFGSSADRVARVAGAPSPILPYTKADGSLGLTSSYAGASRRRVGASDKVCGPLVVVQELEEAGGTRWNAAGVNGNANHVASSLPQLQSPGP